MGGDLYYVATYYGKPREKRGHYRKSDLTLAKNNETRFYAKGTTIKNMQVLEISIEQGKNKSIPKVKRIGSSYPYKYYLGVYVVNTLDEANELVKDISDFIIYRIKYFDGQGIGLPKYAIYIAKNNYAKGTTIEGNELGKYIVNGTIKIKREEGGYDTERVNGSVMANNEAEAEDKVVAYYENRYGTSESEMEVDLMVSNIFAKGTTIKFDKLPKNRQANKNDDYFAVGKIDGKIVESWEIVDDVESLKYYAKIDLKDNDYNPKNFNIVSAKYLIRKGINPFDYNNWRKIDYSTNESAYATKFLEGEIYADGGGVDEKRVLKFRNKLVQMNVGKNDSSLDFAIKVIDMLIDGELVIGNEQLEKGTEYEKRVLKFRNKLVQMNVGKNDSSLDFAIKVIDMILDGNLVVNKFADGGGIKAIFSKEGIEASNPFAFRKKLEFAKKHPELLMLEMGGILKLYLKDEFSEKDSELIDKAIENGDIDTTDIKEDFMGYVYDRIDKEYKDEFKTEDIWEYTDEQYENLLTHKENYKKLISFLKNDEEYAEGGGVEEFNYNPKIDYFSEYHLLPKKVQDIFLKEEYEDSTYESNNKLIKELNGIGWTADYDLSGGMYDLKPIGYEEFSLGGKIDNGYFNNCFLKSIFGV